MLHTQTIIKKFTITKATGA